MMSDNSFESLIPTHERFKHMYITGQSGSGKSEAMKSIIDYSENNFELLPGQEKSVTISARVPETQELGNYTDNLKVFFKRS